MKLISSWILSGVMPTLVVAALGWGSTVHAEVDVLSRPAMLTARPSSMVMLAITKAGGRIIAVGERGTIVYSDNAGINWHQAAVPVSVSLVAVEFINPHDGWAVGHSGVVLRTRDGGKNWIKQLDGIRAAQMVLESVKAGHIRPSKPFLDIHFIDEKKGFLIGAFGLIFATSDGGETWQPALDRINNSDDKHLYSIKNIADECFIAGEQGAVFYSRNCDKDFVETVTPYGGTYFGAVAVGVHAAVVFGMRGNVYWSDNAGGTWHKSGIAASNSITAGLRLKDGSILIADETGQLFRSTDLGKNFQLVPVKQSSPITGIVQSDDGSLFISGIRGVSRIALN